MLRALLALPLELFLWCLLRKADGTMLRSRQLPAPRIEPAVWWYPSLSLSRRPSIPEDASVGSSLA